MKWNYRNAIFPAIIAALALTAAPAAAQNRFKGAARPDSCQSASQYLAYPVPARGIPALTPAPKGYKPFHIEHYGRHGSRWLIGENQYANPVAYLEKADKYGKLTPRGKQLLAQLKKIQNDSQGRLGELTPLGHRQHRGIAARMVKNFPEIFRAGTHVDAKSTVVIRCILSMANEIVEIEKMVPGIITTMDASRTTQKILNYNSSDTVARNLSNETERKYAGEFAKSHRDRHAFLAKVFNDQKFVADSLDGNKVFSAVFDVAANMQSHDDQPSLYDLFTPEELYDEWLVNNAEWYCAAGNTALSNGRVPFRQRVTLRNMIESADTAMVSPHISANLRFGHESILLPLSVLMELNDNGVDRTDLNNLDDHWRNYTIFPMGSNIQMIFYRPEKKAKRSADDVLVKVLLNEEEVKLPVKPVSGPYYRWKDLRDHYAAKLDSFTTRFPK